MPDKFWDRESEPIVIGKNDKGDVIQIKKVMKNNKEFTDVRSWYVDKKTGELKPGKGITIPDDLADEVAEQIMSSANLKYVDEPKKGEKAS